MNNNYLTYWIGKINWFCLLHCTVFCLYTVWWKLEGYSPRRKRHQTMKQPAY